MLDLSSKGIEEWLRFHTEMAPHELMGISRVELPGSIMPALVRFGETLDYALGRDAVGLSERLRGDPGRDLLRTILAQVGPAHCLRLLEWLSQPELGPQHLLFDALLAPDPRGAGEAIRALVRNLHRRALLKRLFAPARLAALLAACRHVASREVAS
jgi:hypothetical protein